MGIDVNGRVAPISTKGSKGQGTEAVSTGTSIALAMNNSNVLDGCARKVKIGEPEANAMQEALMTWDDVLADPSLKDLPYKIELNREGQIVMSPAGRPHALMQMKIASELMARPGGVVLGECGIQTSDGVRVPDVMWASDGWLAADHPDPAPVAPEICVEVVSPGNSAREIEHKVGLYLQAGAREVWVVTVDGERTVHLA